MLKVLLPVTLLLSACGATVSSVDAVCNLKTPTFTESELKQLSDQTLDEHDVFFEEYISGCGDHREAV